MKSLTELLQDIDTLLSEIQAHRPLSQAELWELRKSLWVAFTHHSTAIEGNTLTLGETKLVLEDGLTIWGKTLREIHEVSNHHVLLEMLYDFLQHTQDIDEVYICRIHKEVMKHLDDTGGEYRKLQIALSWDELLPPKASEVPEKMKDFLDWYNKQKDTLHPVLLAWEFHYRFVKIHPFLDGNGRTIRLIFNMILMKQGYPMIILPKIRRAEYISTLHSSSSLQDFLQFFADIVVVNLQDYLRMIEE